MKNFIIGYGEALTTDVSVKSGSGAVWRYPDVPSGIGIAFIRVLSHAPMRWLKRHGGRPRIF